MLLCVLSTAGTTKYVSSYLLQAGDTEVLDNESRGARLLAPLHTRGARLFAPLVCRGAGLLPSSRVATSV